MIESLIAHDLANTKCCDSWMATFTYTGSHEAVSDWSQNVNIAAFSDSILYQSRVLSELEHRKNAFMCEVRMCYPAKCQCYLMGHSFS